MSAENCPFVTGAATPLTVTAAFGGSTVPWTVAGFLRTTEPFPGDSTVTTGDEPGGAAGVEPPMPPPHDAMKRTIPEYHKIRCEEEEFDMSPLEGNLLRPRQTGAVSVPEGDRGFSVTIPGIASKIPPGEKRTDIVDRPIVKPPRQAI